MRTLLLYIDYLSMLTLMALGWGACESASSLPLEESPSNIQVLEAIPVDSVVADFPVGFAFLSEGQQQFVAYYNKDRALTVASRKLSDKKWTYKVLPTKVGWDSHNRIRMAIDKSKCLHLSGNMHNDTLIYFRTEQPYDISTFTQVFPMVDVKDESRCTYPKFIKNAEQELIFSYRMGGSGNGITITNIYDEQTKTFSRLTDEPLFDGRGSMSAYASGPVLGPDKFFHLVWLWRDTPGCETNHDISYARSPDLIHWESAQGQKIDLPISPALSHLTVDPIPPKGGAINGGIKLFFDDNQTLIAYLKYDSLGHSQIFLATLSGGVWASSQVSDWDYRWDFSGPGSINFEIRIRDALVNEKDQIIIAYRHIKLGIGELLIDKNTLSLIEDRATPPTENLAYPPELLSPSSNIDSVEVRWMREPATQASEYHVFRWETMGKRRFYTAPKVPVKPSALMLYKLKRE